MGNDFIDYGKLIDDAMHVIVRKALERVAEEGLPGKHHFFISFITRFPGVSISEALLSKYPEEMTIVLQHQFEDLTVDAEHFSVALSFDNVKESISIPFEALVAFADPSVKFGLQFRHSERADIDDDVAEITEFGLPDNHLEEKGFIEDKLLPQSKDKKGQVKTASKSKKKETKDKDSTNIVNLDAFRKK